MIAKNLARRLERLEEQTPSTDIVRVWQIVTIDSDGNREHGPGYEFRPVPEGGFRPTQRQKTRGR